jgi:hypothetical protein
MGSEGNRVGRLLLAFGLALGIFQIVPALLFRVWKSPLSWGDVMDFLTCLVVVPVALALYGRLRREWPTEQTGRRAVPLALVLFVAGAILYVDGHGIHLPANSLARLMEKGSAIFKATYLYDEVISHYLWHGGLLIMSAALVLAAAKSRVGAAERAISGPVLAGAVFYGFALAVSAVEGQTVPMQLPAAIIGAVAAWRLFLAQRRQGRENPALLFFAAGLTLAAALFAYWGISHGGFPEFSELGWID